MAKSHLGFSPNEKKQRQKASKALSNARQRCTNKNNKDYANYGAMGIQVLIGLDELLAVLGPPQGKATLDRIDPQGHYQADNVQWASKAVQAVNKKMSPTGSTLPLHILVNQQKHIVAQEKLRPAVAEAWSKLILALNRGWLSKSDNAFLTECLHIPGSVGDVLGTRERLINGSKQVTFRMPSLTCPSALVDARGLSGEGADEDIARRYLRFGLLYRLRDVEGRANIPDLVRCAINGLVKSPKSLGLTLIGRPAEADLRTGWFEIWMLAAASRLPRIGVDAAIYPATTCLELLTEFGSRHKWDFVRHPLLDAPLLFIPDFQLDCGPWGYLGNYEFGMLERLLEYRVENEHKTVVGVQAPNRLTAGLKKILLGRFESYQVPNETLSLADLKFTVEAADPALKNGENVCDEALDDSEKYEVY